MTIDDLAEHDRDALQRCMEIASSKDGDRKEQLDSMLATQSWIDVAMFAASVTQSRSLALKPWHEPPSICDEHDENERDKQGQALLRRMLAAGISRFEPDPLAALAEAETRKARRKK